MKDLASAQPAATRARVTSAGARREYSISQAAGLLGVSRVTLWRWIRAGRLPVTRLGHRTARIQHDDLERFLRDAGPAGARTWASRKRGAGAGLSRGTVLPSDGGAMTTSEHFVQFYEADAYLLDAVAEFTGAALRAGDRAIVVATEPHRDGLAERLRAAGCDLTAASADGQYVALDAAEVLSRFMVDGTPDPARFAGLFGDLIARATEGGRGVRIFGEMVALLAADGYHAATIRLEQLWNELQAAYPFVLFCAYPMERLGGEALGQLVASVCAEHGRVIPAASYTALASRGARQLAVTALQQKARSLETEIARRKQAEEQLRVALEAERAAREAAERALRVRNEFLAIAAHELKTPLTSLSGQAQLVLRRFEREGQLEPRRVQQSLQTITGQSQKLSRLINHLLDIARLETGQLAIEPRRTDVAALVAQVVASAQEWSPQHPIDLSAPASLEAEVDPLRFEQVVSNLLDNAVKYSPDGGAIEVALVPRADGTVELSVRDHGLGIPPDKRESIFDRFYQAHADDHRSGLGLGLYICRQIVDLHGGAIRAEFPPDGGTRFVVRLPLAVDELAAARARHERTAPAPGLREPLTGDGALVPGLTG